MLLSGPPRRQLAGHVSPSCQPCLCKTISAGSRSTSRWHRAPLPASVGPSRLQVRLCRRVRAGGDVRRHRDRLRADDPRKGDRRSRLARLQGRCPRQRAGCVHHAAQAPGASRAGARARASSSRHTGLRHQVAVTARHCEWLITQSSAFAVAEHRPDDTTCRNSPTHLPFPIDDPASTLIRWRPEWPGL
ncbi:hypothetical protein ABIF66_003349 [Bradyrhizobium japonicum]